MNKSCDSSHPRLRPHYQIDRWTSAGASSEALPVRLCAQRPTVMSLLPSTIAEVLKKPIAYSIKLSLIVRKNGLLWYLSSITIGVSFPLTSLLVMVKFFTTWLFGVEPSYLSTGTNRLIPDLEPRTLLPLISN